MRSVVWVQCANLCRVCVFKSIDSCARGYGPGSKSVTPWVNSNNNDVLNNNPGSMMKEVGHVIMRGSPLYRGY